MYTVIGSTRTRTLRVLWMLEELGQPYEHLPHAPQSETVRAHYPAGKVPVLLAGDQAITDSVAIMTFLADSHGALTFPAGTLERARQDGHTNFLIEEFDCILWMAGKHSFVLPEELRVPQIKESLRWEFARSRQRLAERLGAGPFLMGERMTFADIIAGQCLGWAKAAKFEVSEPALVAYHERLKARPAFRRALKGKG